jgi:serine/threonine-protein kinase
LIAVMTGASDRELEPGDTLGPYRLESVLGEGGMGLVFKARREGHDRPVALKVLKRQLDGDRIFQQRFQHEARAAAEVHDRHLVAILESAESDGRHYLASDYMDGGSLAERLAAAGPLPLADVVRIVTEVGTGLDALHSAGVVHRDIKPSNVLFDSDGTAMLTDFGLAKGRAYTVLTRPGQVMGTLDYLAPELIRGQPASPATDLYALGCVAFECVAGRAPFGDKGAFQVGLAHLEEPPPDPGAERPELPARFSAAILAPLEKDPERRPATAAAYAGLLRAAAEEAGV